MTDGDTEMGLPIPALNKGICFPASAPPVCVPVGVGAVQALSSHNRPFMSPTYNPIRKRIAVGIVNRDGAGMSLTESAYSAEKCHSLAPVLRSKAKTLTPP